MENSKFDYDIDFKEVFGLMYLYFNHTCINDLRQVLAAFNHIYNKNMTLDQVTSLIQRHLFTFGLDKPMMRNLVESLNREIKSFTKHLYPPIIKCLQCKMMLEVNLKKHMITVYYKTGPEECSIHSSKCNNCAVIYGIDKFRKNGKVYFYSPSIKTEYAQTTSETMFHKSLIREFDEHLIRNAVSLKGNLDQDLEIATTNLKYKVVLFKKDL
jgi:hypothetical protein